MLPENPLKLAGPRRRVTVRFSVGISTTHAFDFYIGEEWNFKEGENAFKKIKHNDEIAFNKVIRWSIDV